MLSESMRISSAKELDKEIQLSRRPLSSLNRFRSHRSSWAHAQHRGTPASPDISGAAALLQTTHCDDLSSTTKDDATTYLIRTNCCPECSGSFIIAPGNARQFGSSTSGHSAAVFTIRLMGQGRQSQARGRLMCSRNALMAFMASRSSATAAACELPASVTPFVASSSSASLRRYEIRRPLAALVRSYLGGDQPRPCQNRSTGRAGRQIV